MWTQTAKCSTPSFLYIKRQKSLYRGMFKASVEFLGIIHSVWEKCRTNLPVKQKERRKESKKERTLGKTECLCCITIDPSLLCLIIYDSQEYWFIRIFNHRQWHLPQSRTSSVDYAVDDDIIIRIFLRPSTYSPWSCYGSDRWPGKKINK